MHEYEIYDRKFRRFEWFDILTPVQRRKKNFRDFVTATSKRK